jgi:hypothetical protein
METEPTCLQCEHPAHSESCSRHIANASSLTCKCTHKQCRRELWCQREDGHYDECRSTKPTSGVYVP